MKFATTTTYLFSLLSFAAAAPATMNSSTSSFEVISLPTEPTTGVVSKRQNDFWGVEYCNAIDFSSNEGCRKDFVRPYTCYNFPNGFINSVSSIRLDKGIACSFYVGTDCTGYALLGVNYPIKDLRQYGGSSTALNDNTESFICWTFGC
ncbi:hypothetical protein QBC42DRAFT_323987 [Cladorrhinum samala]|uniref:Uncharacterized protein n=1 Tax=Cladorrhinum samala TaxID=585594 RepID=A0AAV9HS32_9PEZI|nr:hypothetical protein QBC42DRAFT_323987 [Cladorrhinum samala]